MVWACFATCFSALDFCCTYLCFKLRTVKRKRRRRKWDIEEFAAPITSSSEEGYELAKRSLFQQPRNLEHRRSKVNRRRNYKYEHLRRSLRPTSHRAHVHFSANPFHLHWKKILKNIGDHTSPLHHHIRVTRSSKFSQKGSKHRTRIHQPKR
ncbi:hypothetical protein CDL12_10284 [Handroanthus impetiginosus]|uniref:Uncharacterized protein n=1 Tax=Handroanthus impetiginosus TaxID=429701 RepID=A0A2G9HHQ1_9LAMI|nr:hypothetical protein CDL12_10284 [Handroanthus impetiginosus]